MTNVSDSGDGSLRAAIISSNAATGSNTIDFDIPGTGVQTISLLSPLPSLINPTDIDATTQPGYAGTPLVELNGASILDTTVNPPTQIPNVNALSLTGGASTVKGLDIERFTGSGIVASGDGNTIAANFIGTDPTGTQSPGNMGYGVALSGRNNVVGGADPASRNVISANALAGIYLGGTDSALPTNNLVEGNDIGTDLTGTLDLGNYGAGVDLESSNNTIGVDEANGTGVLNIIAFNGGPGVLVGNSPYVSYVNYNRIQGNSIFDNVNLGINFGDAGPTENIPDYNYGPNKRQPYPDLTSAYPGSGGNGTVVEGSLVASPNSIYTVDFYANPEPDPSGYGQGKTPLGSETVTTNAYGVADVTTELSASGEVGQYISATATDANGNTSEFGLSRLVTPTAESDLSVTATIPNPTVVAGTIQTYTFTVQNNGPSYATNVIFNDILPAGATMVSGSYTTASGQSPLSAPSTNGIISQNIGGLAIETSSVVTVNFTLPTAGSAVNKVSATADQPDPMPANSLLTQNITVNAAAPVDLSISGSSSPYPVQVGDMLTYTFYVSNNSSNPGTGVTVNDPLPTSLKFVSVTASQGVAISVGNDVTVALGSLSAFTTASVTIIVEPTTTGSISNTATVHGNESDPYIFNNTTTVYTYVNPMPAIDVAVAISAAPSPAAVNQPFLYVVTAGNPGSAPATGVTVTDVLPTAAAIGSITMSQGTYTLNGDVLTANFGNLAIGALAEVTIALTPGAPGFLVNRASITAAEPEFNIYNNFAAVATPVIGQAFAPAVLTQQLNVSGNRITSVTLTFNEDMDPLSASMLANYEVEDLGSNGSLSANGKKVTISSAVYNAITRSVTLTFKSGLNIGRFYKLIANGPGAPGLVDVNGNVLSGENNGLQNSIYESLIGRGTSTRPVALQVGVTPRAPTPHAAAPAKHRK